MSCHSYLTASKHSKYRTAPSSSVFSLFPSKSLAIASSVDINPLPSQHQQTLASNSNDSYILPPYIIIYRLYFQAKTIPATKITDNPEQCSTIHRMPSSFTGDLPHTYCLYADLAYSNASVKTHALSQTAAVPAKGPHLSILSFCFSEAYAS